MRLNAIYNIYNDNHVYPSWYVINNNYTNECQLREEVN